MKFLSFLVISLWFFINECALAQSISTPPAVSGFVDMYYSMNVQHPTSRVNRLRNFDIAENQFVVILVEIDVQRKDGPVGFRLDAAFGTANDVVQSGSSSATLPLLQQAYLTAVLPVGSGLTVDAGKFVTHMGYEVIESKDNWNYSRSLLFAWAVPYYHTGLRLSYPVAENLTTAMHIVNGWNSVQDNNDTKSLGLTLTYVPFTSTTFIVNTISGSEDFFVSSTLYETGLKRVIDATLVHKFSESLSITVNADYGESRTSLGLAVWKGAALYGRYAFNTVSSVALRGEYFNDRQGYATGTGLHRLELREFSATYEYLFAGPLSFRGEFRHDVSGEPVFDNEFGTSMSRLQSTFLIGIATSF